MILLVEPICQGNGAKKKWANPIGKSEITPPTVEMSASRAKPESAATTLELHCRSLCISARSKA